MTVGDVEVRMTLLDDGVRVEARHDDVSVSRVGPTWLVDAANSRELAALLDLLYADLLVAEHAA